MLDWCQSRLHNPTVPRLARFCVGRALQGSGKGRTLWQYHWLPGQPRSPRITSSGSAIPSSTRSSRGRPRPGCRRTDLGLQARAGLDAPVPVARARHLQAQAAPNVAVGRPERDRLRQHLLLPASHRQQRREELGRRAGLHQGDLRQAGHPGGRAKVPGRRLGPVRVGSGVPLDPGRPGQAGRHLSGHGLGPARVPGPGQGVLRDGDPGSGQQVLGAQLSGLVGRQLHLRAEEHPCRDAAAGLLPINAETWRSSPGR